MLKGKYVRAAIFTAIALWLTACALYALNAFERIENALYRTFYQHVSAVDTRIVLIGIDEDSIAELGQWPWPRSLMAELLDKLAESGASAIGVDVEYDTPSRDIEEDNSLIRAINNAGNVALPVRGLFDHRTATVSGGYVQADGLVVPIEQLRPARLGHVNTVLDDDDAVRRALLNLSYDGVVYPSMAYALYDISRVSLGLPDIYSDIPVDASGSYYIGYTGRSGWYHPLSFSDVYEGKVPLSYFNNKIVLIGMYAHGAARDWHFTAIDGDFATNGVEIHANMLQQMLEGEFLRDMHPLSDFALFFLFSLAGAILFIRCRPRLGLIALVALLAANAGVVFLLIRAGIVVQMSYTPLFCALAYCAVLIWHYTQTRVNEARVRGTFGRYMAPPVIKKILDEGEGNLKLGGQRRYVSVLFVDIRGFTTMSEGLPPEEVVYILNEYLDLVASCIHRHGGTLDKFIGDAAMAIWNAPYDTENHTLAAVRAALDMQREAAPLEQKLFEKYGRSVRFGVGINSGEVIIGNIGASFRMDYTAIGDTVNTAARLESSAKPGQILISRAAADLISGSDIALNPLGRIKVKGKNEEIEVFETSVEFKPD
jgi:adenylate cyclase